MAEARSLYLKGPITGSKLQSGNKTFYIFGDYHDILGVCPLGAGVRSINIDELIEQTIVSNKTKLIDVYLEIATVSPSHQKRIAEPIDQSYAWVIYEKFKECLQLKKGSCTYKNSRFHYIDIRESEMPIIRALNMLGKISVNFLAFKNYNIYTMAGSDFEYDVISIGYDFEKYIGIKMTNTYNFLTEHFIPWAKNKFTYMEILRALKIYKQIDSIDNVSIRNKLYMEIETLIKNSPISSALAEYVGAILNLYRNTGNGQKDNGFTSRGVYGETLSSSILNIGISVNNFMSKIMDIYTVARMLRKYKELPSMYSDVAINVIYFAGEFHANNIKNLLINVAGFTETWNEISMFDIDKKTYNSIPPDKLGNYIDELVNKNKGDKNKSFQCLNISELEFPLFSK